MLDVAVVEDREAAQACLDPTRSALLAALAVPGSATTLAAITGVARQKVNYHLRALETCGLVELVEERRKGGFTERVVRATALSYVISPSAASVVAPDTDRTRDERSGQWMVALGARLVRDVGTLLDRARAAEQPLATFALDSEVTFASAADRAAYLRDLSAALETLGHRYASTDQTGRRHRVVLALHPSITKES